MDCTENSNAISWQHIGIGGLLAGFLLVADTPALTISTFPSGEQTQVFFISALLTLIVMNVAFMMRGALSSWIFRTRFNAGSLIAAFGMVGISLLEVLSLGDFGYMLFGIIFGLGISFSLLLWSFAYSDLSESSSFKTTALACCVAGGLKLTALALSSFISFNILIALVFLLSSILPTQKVTNKAEEWLDPINVFDRLRDTTIQNWKLFCGFLLCLIIFAFMWSATVAEQYISNYPDNDTSWGGAIGFLTSSLIMFFLASKLSRSSIRVVFQVTPLICITGGLTVWFFGLQNTVGFAKVIFSMPFGIALAALGILLWVRLVSSNNGLSPAFTVGLGSSVCISTSLIAYAIWPMVGDSIANAVDLILMVIYLAAIGAEAIIASQKRSALSKFDFDEALEDRVKILSARYSLSKRETEIFRMIIEGRSAPSIAEDLFVSINTIKTHTKRIYAKADVHSKEELMELIRTGIN